MADTSLWPMAVDHVVHHRNDMRRAVTGTISPLNSSWKQKCHAWISIYACSGYPCYVLELKVTNSQNGNHVPYQQSSLGSLPGTHPMCLWC